MSRFRVFSGLRCLCFRVRRLGVCRVSGSVFRGKGLGLTVHRSPYRPVCSQKYTWDIEAPFGAATTVLAVELLPP